MKTETPITIAKARFIVRYHLERVEQDYGSSTRRDLESAIQALIDHAVANCAVDNILKAAK